MPYTTHGHFHGRYTPGDAQNIPVTAERCGGLDECDECKAEAKAARKAALGLPAETQLQLQALGDVGSKLGVGRCDGPHAWPLSDSRLLPRHA